MRKNFIRFVLIPLVFILLIVYLFIDRWVTSGLETAGESMVGAKVEIEGLHVTLSPLGIHWGRMQVANPNDPWRNLFEANDVHFAMDAGQLLRNKYIIETIMVGSLVLGRHRETDGSLPGGSRKSGNASLFSDIAGQALGNLKQQAPAIDIDRIRSGVNADSLVKILNIRTVGYIDSLTRQVKSSSQQWDATMKDIANTGQRLTDVGSKIRAINSGELKSIDKIQSALATVNEARTTVSQVSETFETRKASVTADLNTISGAVSGIDDVAKQDFQRLLALAKLPNLNTSGIAPLLVGNEMERRATTYLHWVDFARTHIKNSSPSPGFEQPPRLRGQTILFPEEHSYPKLWIKHVLIAGQTSSDEPAGEIHGRGEASNITSNQKLTHHPMILTLQTSRGDKRNFALRVIIDRTTDVPEDEFTVSFGGIPLSGFSLGGPTFLPSTITGATLASSVKIVVPGNRFESTTRMAFSGMTLNFSQEPKNAIERITRDVLKDISAMHIGLRLWNTEGPFKIALETDLDNQIASRLKDVVGAEFLKAQNALRAKLDNVIAAKRQEFESLYNAKRQEVNGRLNQVESSIAEQRGMIDAKQKELTDRVEQAKKGAIDQTLKKIFK